MADNDITRPVESGQTSKVEELNGLNFDSIEQGEHMNVFLKNHRKRFPTRSYAGFALSTLSLRNETTTRVKKRNRKDDKRVVIDRVDGFTFISAFTLNDFDEYEKNPVKHPLAPTKRKLSTKTGSTVPKKRVKSPMVEELGSSVNAKGQQGEKIEPVVVSETGSNKAKTNVSPLTKSALVRLKKINLCGLNKSNNSLVNKPTKNSTTSKVKKSINMKIPSGNRLHSSQCKGKKCSRDPLMLIGQHSSDEDSTELDICGVDESSSSQFIIKNINMPDEKQSIGPSLSKDEEKTKQKRKPCRVCCAYPCRIVGARRVKSSDNQFPTFDVSFTSRCQVHTPGEIAVHNSSQGKVNVCIQTTFTDIRMHLDFAKRFPYHAISVVSCQPSLYDDDLKLPDNIASGSTPRCSENHRVLEQKRREELHGLYCKLADTLSISKNRASKQWILENAMRQIKCLEAKDKLLTAKMNCEKSDNEKKRKRWEELAGKPYVASEKSVSKVSGKSKLLELYEMYRQERDQAEEESKSKESELKNPLKIKDGIKKEIQKKIMDSKRQQKEVNNAGKSVEESVKQVEVNSSTVSNNNRPVVNPVFKNPGTREANVMTLKTLQTNNFVGPETSNVPPTSTSTIIATSKYSSLGPQQIVQPFQRQPVPSNTQEIPKIDLTSEPETSTPKSADLPAVNHPPTAPSNVTPSLFKSPPPTQNSSLQTPTTYGKNSPNTNFPNRISAKPSEHSPVSPANTDCVVVRLAERDKTTIVQIPKSQEGLTILNKLCLMNKLSPDLAKKIAAHIHGKRSEQPAAITTSLPATNSLVLAPPTPLQWSTVASLPKTSASPVVPSQFRPLNTAINESDRVGRFSVTRPSRVVNINEENTDIQQLQRPQQQLQQQQRQQPRNIAYLDLTNKPETNTFSVMPTSSSINVTLNRLGSITANKVFNKSPVPVRSQNSVPKIVTAPVGLTFQTHPPNTSFIEGSSLSKDCHLPQTPPVRVQLPNTIVNVPCTGIPLPAKSNPLLTTSIPQPTTNVPISSRSLQVPTEDPPVDLPEIPADISSDLTKASFSPLEAIPQISDTLLGDTSQNESGLCIISNVFSLTDATNVSTAKSLEKTSDVNAAFVQNLAGKRDP